MKFRTIFILFNIVLVFSFSFMFLMPFFLLGASYLAEFWVKNWPLAAFFIAVLVAFNVFFARNWRLFMLVEAEDWQALSAWLKEAMFKRGALNRRYAKLYVNACLLRSDLSGVAELEKELAAKKPGLLARDAALFVAARLLGNDHAGVESLAGAYAANPRADNRPWLRFYEAFARVLQKRAAEAAPAMGELAGDKDPPLALLASYLLAGLCASALRGEEREAARAKALSSKAGLVKRYGREAWAREIAKAKAEVHIVILSKLLDEAGAWLFAQDEAAV